MACVLWKAPGIDDEVSEDNEQKVKAIVAAEGEAVQWEYKEAEGGIPEVTSDEEGSENGVPEEGKLMY